MFGAWLQQPAVLIGFAALMLVLASSMFGALEIQRPAVHRQPGDGAGGLAGALTMGLSRRHRRRAVCRSGGRRRSSRSSQRSASRRSASAMFAALAFGLGFPYLVVLNALPKPGEWMVQVKKAMGFVLIAMAFYFLRPLIGETSFPFGVAASLLVGAVFLVLRVGALGAADAAAGVRGHPPRRSSRSRPARHSNLSSSSSPLLMATPSPA